MTEPTDIDRVTQDDALSTKTPKTTTLFQLLQLLFKYSIYCQAPFSLCSKPTIDRPVDRAISTSKRYINKDSYLDNESRLGQSPSRAIVQRLQIEHTACLTSL